VELVQLFSVCNYQLSIGRLVKEYLSRLEGLFRFLTFRWEMVGLSFLDVLVAGSCKPFSVLCSFSRHKDAVVVASYLEGAIGNII
jgi:hypothetical protein